MPTAKRTSALRNPAGGGVEFLHQAADNYRLKRRKIQTRLVITMAQDLIEQCAKSKDKARRARGGRLQVLLKELAPDTGGGKVARPGKPQAVKEPVPGPEAATGKDEAQEESGES